MPVNEPNRENLVNNIETAKVPVQESSEISKKESPEGEKEAGQQLSTEQYNNLVEKFQDKVEDNIKDSKVVEAQTEEWMQNVMALASKKGMDIKSETFAQDFINAILLGEIEGGDYLLNKVATDLKKDQQAH